MFKRICYTIGYVIGSIVADLRGDELRVAREESARTLARIDAKIAAINGKIDEMEAITEEMEAITEELQIVSKKRKPALKRVK